MKQFEINKNEAQQRLDKYLRKLLPEANGSFIYKMLRKKNITLNEKKATGAERLACGDIVKVFFSDETFEKFQPSQKLKSFRKKGTNPLPVLYEDEDILVLNKPVGMLSQKAGSEDISANEHVIQYLLESHCLEEKDLQTFRPSVCNRLDRNTSGILIAGKTLHGLQEMSRQLKERRIAKYYRCIVAGNVQNECHLKGYLVKDHDSNQAYITKTQMPEGQAIETEFAPIRQYQGYTMLEVHLITGRSHQIRAQLADMGHPVVGDAKYGNESINQYLRRQAGLRHQLLHAYRIVFEDGMEVVAPLPETFQRVEAVLKITKK